MCITTKFTEETLKSIRQSENNPETMSDKEVCEALIKVKKIKEDMEKAYKYLQNILEQRDFNDTVLVPELESKVYLAEGRKTTSIENYKAVKILGVDRFVEVSKITQGNLTDEEKSALVPAIVEEYGKPTISVRKMSKKELQG